MELMLKINHTVEPNGMVTEHNGEMMPKLRPISNQEIQEWREYIKKEVQK